MYVGRHRLDYVEKFASGFILHRLLMSSQTESVSNEISEMYSEMQYWIMLHQSACIRRNASINAWSLFYKCYGVKNVAISNFTKYLYAVITPKFIRESVYSQDSCVARDINELINVLKYDMEANLPFLKNKAKSSISEMIIGAGHKYDSVKVYVWRDDFFSQTRFVYYYQDKWVEDIELIRNDTNYEKLIELHAAIECIESDDFKLLEEYDDSVGFYLVDKSSQLKCLPYSSADDEVSEEESLHSKYQEWREQF